MYLKLCTPFIALPCPEMFTVTLLVSALMASLLMRARNLLSLSATLNYRFTRHKTQLMPDPIEGFLGVNTFMIQIFTWCFSIRCFYRLLIQPALQREDFNITLLGLLIRFIVRQLLPLVPIFSSVVRGPRHQACAGHSIPRPQSAGPQTGASSACPKHGPTCGHCLVSQIFDMSTFTVLSSSVATLSTCENFSTFQTTDSLFDLFSQDLQVCRVVIHTRIVLKDVRSLPSDFEDWVCDTSPSTSQLGFLRYEITIDIWICPRLCSLILSVSAAR